MVIFFRHCRKAYRNNRKPDNVKGMQHDPHIIFKQENFHKNLSHLKPPKMIISSPFLRCRQTCGLILKYYQDFNIPIKITPLIREYNPNYSLFEMDKKSGGPYPIEDIHDLHFRIQEFFEKYQDYLNSNDVWIISHSSFIKHFIRYYKGRTILLNQGDYKMINF